MRRLTRMLLIGCGAFCVALGMIGFVVPLMPATPFLLLAAACFARSSARLHRWLLTNRWSGEYLRNYRAHRGMSVKHKALTIALLWLSLGASARWGVSQWWARALLAAVAIGVTIHLFRLRTYRPAPQAAPAGEAELPRELAG